MARSDDEQTLGQRSAEGDDELHPDPDHYPRVRYGHPAMPLSERAKIFQPFDPLRGYRDLLRQKEREAEERQG